MVVIVIKSPTKGIKATSSFPMDMTASALSRITTAVVD
jgi:hypothetical protein